MEAMITHGLYKVCRGNDENSRFVLRLHPPIVGELFDSVVLLLILLAVQKSTVEDGE